jgi:hypothetical protein
MPVTRSSQVSIQQLDAVRGERARAYPLAHAHRDEEHLQPIYALLELPNEQPSPITHDRNVIRAIARIPA